MPKYKIKSIGPIREYEFNGDKGTIKMKAYTVQFEGSEDWVDISRKTESPAPNLGEEVEGEIESNQYGKRFKSAKKSGSGWIASPEKEARITGQNAYERAVQLIIAEHQLGKKPLTIDNELFIRLQAVADRVFLYTWNKKPDNQPDAKTTPQAVQDITQEPLEGPTEDINIEDIPF